MITTGRASEAVPGSGAVSTQMTKPWWAGQPPGGQRGEAAGEGVGTESPRPGFELGLCPRTGSLALALPLSHAEPYSPTCSMGTVFSASQSCVEN